MVFLRKPIAFNMIVTISASFPVGKTGGLKALLLTVPCSTAICSAVVTANSYAF